MKKKYFAPEMEELEMDEPVVLDESSTSSIEEPIVTCPPESEEA